jgi:small-conductance mechanosensitive channel
MEDQILQLLDGMNFPELSKDNEILFLFITVVATLILAWILRLLLKFLTKNMRRLTVKNRFAWDDILFACFAETRCWFLFAWISVPAILSVEKLITASDQKMDPAWGRVGKVILIVASAIQLVIWGLKFIQEWRQRTWHKDAEAFTPAMGLLYTSLQGLLVITVSLIALNNLGINIGALVTGLGIGGVAVALAAQNVLGDFLASLSIVLDKPFVNGDYIVVGSEEGDVENIGIKTTRVRSISGEELIFSNKDLLESRIHNFKRMRRRRVAHTLSVSAMTPPEKVRLIPKWVKEIFPRHDKLTFDRFHLASFGESTLNYQLVFWVEDPNYNLYMDLQEELLFDIFAKLMNENVQYGYPVRNIRLEKPAEVRESLAALRLPQ